MPVPSPRNPIRPARGLLSDLNANIVSIEEGEICYAEDLDQYYQKENSVLVPVGASGPQGALADSSLQPGDIGVTVQPFDADTVIDADYVRTDENFTTADHAKLDGIEAGATADQTDAEIKTAYENNADTNAFTDAEQAKLAGIEAGATADQTDAEIKTAYENNADTNAFTDAEQAKLAGIEAGATEDQTDAEIKTAYENNANTNAFTDAEQTKLGNIEAGAQVNTVDSVAGKTGAVTLDKTDVGLDNVDNTSDADKPVSTATQSALDDKADLVGGVIPNSQLPSLAISEYLGEVASQAAMLALTGQRGDWCIRTDTSSTFVLSGDDSSQLSNWVELATPADAVTSVNGFQGTVVLGPSDVGAATAAQGALADSATQPGDLATVATSGSYDDLSDKPSIPPTAPVDSVNTQTGAVVLDADDIDDTSTTHKFATAAQLSNADSALQSGDVDLSLANRGTETLDVANSAGDDVTIPAATTSLTGLMSAQDKTDLDDLVAGGGSLWDDDGSTLTPTDAGRNVDIDGNISLAGDITNTTTDGDQDIICDGAGLIKVTEYNLDPKEVVTLNDIGTAANEIPINGYLGPLAYQAFAPSYNGVWTPTTFTIGADSPTVDSAVFSTNGSITFVSIRWSGSQTYAANELVWVAGIPFALWGTGVLAGCNTGNGTDGVSANLIVRADGTACGFVSFANGTINQGTVTMTLSEEL